MRTTNFIHAAHPLGPDDLLLALVAERLDRLADRMIRRAHDRLALFGRLEHAAWLHDNIHGMRGFPIVAYLTRPGLERQTPERFLGRPVLRADDERVADLLDTVLISDDRHERDLHDLALRLLPPGVIIHRLYERLPIGETPLVTPTLRRIAPRAELVSA